MLLILVAYLGGVLTIVSPCILPVLPFVFARANRSFWRSSLPMLAGMAVTFAGVASLAAVGGGWAVQANQAGRWAALILLAFFGLTLLFPTLADRAMQPLVRLGGRLSERAEGEERDSVWTALLLGVATGLLWAPCAGPILGLILTGAALNGASASTTLLLLAYALGAATSLALALLIGGRVFKAMKKSLGAGQWVRRALGLLVLLGVGAIALGLDTTYLARLSSAQTDAIERTIAGGVGQDMPASSEVSQGADGRLNLPVEREMPPLDGITQWLNSNPLTRESLRGRVVLIDFWTYSCINCIRSIPYVQAWHERYARDGLVVIGVHAPEFAFERDVANVQRSMRDLGITYPVAIDNNFAVWRAFANRYWPAHYSSMPRAASATTVSARAITSARSRSSASSSPRPAAARLPPQVRSKRRGSTPRHPKAGRARRKPISAMPAPRISSRRADRCGTGRAPIWRAGWRSTTGRSPATGSSASSMPRRRRAAAASPSASKAATCIW